MFCYSSYDTWVSASEVDGDVEDPPSTDRPWKVINTRDFQLFNKILLENIFNFKIVIGMENKLLLLVASVESGHTFLFNFNFFCCVK